MYKFGLLSLLNLGKVGVKNGWRSLLLVVVVFALYGQFLWNPIVFDDLYFFMLDNEGNQPVSSYHFELLQLRSLPYASLAWTKAWFGLDLINFRIGNLLLHAGVVLALFFFLTSLFTAVIGDDKEERLSPRMAAFSPPCCLRSTRYQPTPWPTWSSAAS